MYDWFWIFLLQDAIIYGAAAGGGAVLILAIAVVVYCVVRSRREKSNSSKVHWEIILFHMFRNDCNEFSANEINCNNKRRNAYG